MSKDSVLPYFARGFNNKLAIEVLRQLGSKRIDSSLALNPYLDGADVNAILRSSHPDARAMVALRLDLTIEHMQKILRGKSGLPRQALLTRSRGIHVRLPIEVAAEAIKADWFAPEYSAPLLNLLPYESSPTRLRVAAEGRQAGTWKKSSAFRANKERIRDLGHQNFYDHYMELALQPSTKGIDSNYDLEFDPLDEPLPQVIARYRKDDSWVHPEITCKLVDDLLPEVPKEFYTIFLNLLPDWRLTLREAIDAALSLLGSPVSN